MLSVMATSARKLYYESTAVPNIRILLNECLDTGRTQTIYPESIYSCLHDARIGGDHENNKREVTAANTPDPEFIFTCLGYSSGTEWLHWSLSCLRLRT